MENNKCHGKVMENDAMLRMSPKEKSTEMKAVDEQLNQKLKELKNTE